jgi:predicted CXXCH cytochrome family protein
MRRPLLFIVLFANGSCEPRKELHWTVRTDARRVDVREATWSPSNAVRSIRQIGPERVELTLRSGFRGTVQLEIPGACPVVESFAASSADRESEAYARVELPEYLSDVGFDRDVDVIATSRCGPVPSLTWSVATGKSTTLKVAQDGTQVRVHTPRMSEALAPAQSMLPTWGIVPIAPRTQGEIVIEARAQGIAKPYRVVVTSAVRATGVPTVPAGGHVYLFGEGWSATPDVHGHAPKLAAQNGFTQVETDLSGKFVLRDSAGKRLGVRFGRYDEMPLDCARAGCHVEVGQTIDKSPMTSVFEHGLAGAFGPDYDATCALGCHTVGEPGQDDGGFLHLAERLGTRIPTTPSPEWFANMPRDLRRTSGVGCMTCHGPAAIPEPEARARILRANVCATCHDAPPKYNHVSAWQSSRMANSDSKKETRSGACATCHTTAGFLVAIGARKPREHDAFEDGEPMGITCAACHSPHAANSEASLVRKVPGVDGASAAVCVACHGGMRTEKPEDLPAATSALLLAAPGPHTTERSCLTCHSQPRGSESSGTTHSFRADAKTCTTCHATPPIEAIAPEQASISARADRLFGKLVARGVILADPGSTPHAGKRYGIAARSELAQIARSVAMVHDDKAAAVHNATKARQILDEAERVLR